MAMQNFKLALTQARSINRLCFALMTTFMMAACTGDVSDLETFVENTKTRYQGSVEPPPPFEPYANYVYSTGEMRDPFSEPAKKDDPSAQGSPEGGRRKEPLEFFPLDTLKMVGVIEQRGQIWGLVRDPEGKIHRVQRGDHAGQNYGEITLITDTKINFLEIVADGQGGWVEREISLSLSEI